MTAPASPGFSANGVCTAFFPNACVPGGQLDCGGICHSLSVWLRRPQCNKQFLPPGDWKLTAICSFSVLVSTSNCRPLRVVIVSVLLIGDLFIWRRQCPNLKGAGQCFQHFWIKFREKKQRGRQILFFAAHSFKQASTPMANHNDSGTVGVGRARRSARAALVW